MFGIVNNSRHLSKQLSTPLSTALARWESADDLFSGQEVDGRRILRGGNSQDTATASSSTDDLDLVLRTKNLFGGVRTSTLPSNNTKRNNSRLTQAASSSQALNPTDVTQGAATRTRKMSEAAACLFAEREREREKEHGS